jgi:hypothetical protein
LQVEVGAEEGTPVAFGNHHVGRVGGQF